MRAPLKYDDVQLGPAALCLGSCAHPRCVAADDDKPFFAHGLSSGVEYQGKDESVPQVALRLTQLQIIVPCLVSIAHEVGIVNVITRISEICECTFKTV